MHFDAMEVLVLSKVAGRNAWVMLVRESTKFG